MCIRYEVNVNITAFWDTKTWDLIAKGHLSTTSHSITSLQYNNLTRIAQH